MKKTRKPAVKKAVKSQPQGSVRPDGVYYFLMRNIGSGPRKDVPTFIYRTRDEVESFLLNVSNDYDVYEVEACNVRKVEKKICWTDDVEYE